VILLPPKSQRCHYHQRVIEKRQDEKAIFKERQLRSNHFNTMYSHLTKHLYQCYGFVCDPLISVHQNALQLLASMPIELYFLQPSNSAFHNLCTTSKIPASCRSLLGLGLNFCLQPLTTAGKSSVDFTHFQRDIYTRMFFAHSLKSTPLLFIRSSWEPPSDHIPTVLTT
jgi:hypothetical protein